MRTTTISHRYARAIFGPPSRSKLARVAGDLANVLALNRQDSAFLNFLDDAGGALPTARRASSAPISGRSSTRSP